MKGIPLRVEMGPRDIENGQCVMVRRDNGEKVTVNLTELEDKTGIIRRFHRMQEQFGQMETAVDAIAQRNEAHWQDDELESLCGQLKGVLAQLKQE